LAAKERKKRKAEGTKPIVLTTDSHWSRRGGTDFTEAKGGNGEAEGLGEKIGTENGAGIVFAGEGKLSRIGSVAEGMDPPDLRALQSGDGGAWDAAFPWLWRPTLAAASSVLHLYLPADVEDTVMETMEELVEKVKVVKSFDELRRLAASIAHNRAVSRLRQYFAAKRGGGRTESLEGRLQERGELSEAIAADSPVAALEAKELAERVGRLLAALKPPQGEMLTDAFLRGMSYEEIAKKHGVSVGSVGAYLNRGREAMRRAWEGKNK
jgi:RNA polymerase sigma factor (sigma-70 family)